VKIGILSDPHHNIEEMKALVDHLISAGAEHLVCAGDVVCEENLEILEQSRLPYTAVFGNNDHALINLTNRYAIFHEPHYFKLAGLRWKLMHMPFHIAPLDCDVIVYGHTHEVKFQYNGKTLVINPGEICARDFKKHEAVLLEIHDTFFTITHYFKPLSGTHYDQRVLEYTR